MCENLPMHGETKAGMSLGSLLAGRLFAYSELLSKFSFLLVSLFTLNEATCAWNRGSRE